jgi:hypothetical protein
MRSSSAFESSPAAFCAHRILHREADSVAKPNEASVEEELRAIAALADLDGMPNDIDRVPDDRSATEVERPSKFLSRRFPATSARPENCPCKVLALYVPGKRRLPECETE